MSRSPVSEYDKPGLLNGESPQLSMFGDGLYAELGPSRTSYLRTGRSSYLFARSNQEGTQSTGSVARDGTRASGQSTTRGETPAGRGAKKIERLSSMSHRHYSSDLYTTQYIVYLRTRIKYMTIRRAVDVTVYSQTATKETRGQDIKGLFSMRYYNYGSEFYTARYPVYLRAQIKIMTVRRAVDVLA